MAMIKTIPFVYSFKLEQIRHAQLLKQAPNSNFDFIRKYKNRAVYKTALVNASSRAVYDEENKTQFPVNELVSQ